MGLSLEFPTDATPLVDYSDLKINWVHNIQDLNRVEAENIAMAQRKYLLKKPKHPIAWFHIRELRQMHFAMFCHVWGWAGKFRKSITSIGIKPQLIPSELAHLCHEVENFSDSLTLFEKAARVHHGLVHIHPFENGNGRFSRLVADRYLLAFGSPHPIWPDSLHHTTPIRKTYIAALKEADDGSYSSLIQFMETYSA